MTPTDEMINAGAELFENAVFDDTRDMVERIWLAMMRAAVTQANEICAVRPSENDA